MHKSTRVTVEYIGDGTIYLRLIVWFTNVMS